MSVKKLGAVLMVAAPSRRSARTAPQPRSKQNRSGGTRHDRNRADDTCRAYRSDRPPKQTRNFRGVLNGQA